MDDNYSLLDAILMLLADSCFYFIVTWYVDQINPGEFGVPRPWNFPFTVSGGRNGVVFLKLILWFCGCHGCHIDIDENRPDLSRFNSVFFICQICCFSGYGYSHISGSLNFINNIFRILFCQAILIYGVIW